MLIVGLAGGIATGKSLIAEAASKLPGVAILDADKVAWETYRKGTAVYAQLVQKFGEKILANDDEIDRKKLGAIIFNDEVARQFLNSLVHPAVGARLHALAEEYRAQGTKLLLIETALLLESSYAAKDFYDYVILVKADAPEQIRRLRLRDDISQEEAEKRVHSRVPIEQQIAKADFVLDTTGTPNETRARAQELFSYLLSQA